MSRKTKNQLPATPIEFPRADPAELAKFDPSTKICVMNCVMNCGGHRDDPRDDVERKLLCDDCQTDIPKPPAPARDETIRMAREAGAGIGSSGRWLVTQAELERFASIAAAAEREACVKVCKGPKGGALQTDEWWRGFNTAVQQIVAGIRARSRA